MKRIVVLGGGVGGSNIINALSMIPDTHTTCVVNTTDNGGHSGAIRRELDIVPPGDLRRVICHLLSPSVMNQYEFRNDQGEVFGNTVLAGEIRTRGLVAGIRIFISTFPEFPKERIDVWPVSDKPADLCMCLQDTTYVGQLRVLFDRPVGTFGNLSLNPLIDLLPEARKAIERADAVIIAPSGVVGSIAPILLVQGVRKLIQRVSKLIWFVPLFSLPMDGQNPWAAYKAIIEGLTRSPDLVIANSHQLPVEIERLYREKGFCSVHPDEDGNLKMADLLAIDEVIPREPPGTILTPRPRYFIHVQHDIERSRVVLSDIL